MPAMRFLRKWSAADTGLLWTLPMRHTLVRVRGVSVVLLTVWL
jgi:hypothetical protein